MSRSIRLVITERAAQSIVEQAEYYLHREGHSLAQRWDAAALKAIGSLRNTPGSGALCGFRDPELRNLRHTGIPGFPRHLIFYEWLRDQSLIRVVDVVHGARDIEALLTERLT